jgi:glycosyltransferase involved in cell wall biosynthesis
LDSNKDKVSVVIPVYNTAKFLRESIDSVLNQTHPNIEIIAVNDGSTDNSLEVLEKYSDRINVISQPNQGLTAALNTGIEKTNGKWFKWFSPDDVLYPDTIETLVKTGDSLPEDTIIYSNWEMIDEQGKKLRNFSESNYNKLNSFDFNIRLLDGQQVNVNTTLAPASLIKKCGFQNLEDPVAIDYDFFLRAGILHQAKFYLIEKNLVKYRINKNQLSHRDISKTLSYLDKVRDNILSKLDSDKKQEYISALSQYRKSKPMSCKTMEIGLKFFNKTLPIPITDSILRFYLNKIRTHR